jgi:hypothetical protein
LFHLYDIRTEIPELHGAVRAGQNPREVNDAKSIERAHLQSLGSERDMRVR